MYICAPPFHHFFAVGKPQFYYNGKEVSTSISMPKGFFELHIQHMFFKSEPPA